MAVRTWRAMCGNGVRAGMTLIRTHGSCGAGPGSAAVQSIFAARSATTISRGFASFISGFVVPRAPPNPVPFFLFFHVETTRRVVYLRLQDVVPRAPHAQR